MTKRFCLVLLTTTVFTFFSTQLVGAEDRVTAADAFRAAMRLEYQALKAAKEEQNRQQISAYRDQLEVRKEAQIQQVESLYAQAYAARQQMSLHQTQMGYAAAMHAAANRPVTSTEILNPRTEIMQGRFNQKIMANQDNMVGNFINLRAY